MADRTRMLDIARAADVSKTTVSLVLNHNRDARIPEATRARVFRVAQELGYPLPVTPQAQEARQRLVGVLVNEISSAYPINLLDGLQTAAEAQGVGLVLQITGGVAEQEREALMNLHCFGVSGLVYAMTFNARVAPVVEIDRFPHVYLNCRRADGGGEAFVIAESEGGFAATRHLIEIGCRSIATIIGDPWQVATRERLEGCRRALSDAGQAPVHIHSAKWGHRRAAELTREMLQSTHPPDGIFCQNDLMARGAIAALHEMGHAVPQEVAVIGYDDREFARDMAPSLSTITNPYAEMAEAALERLCSAEPLGQGRHVYPGTLIVRQSTRRAAGVA